jgi:hypothetical protein
VVVVLIWKGNNMNKKLGPGMLFILALVLLYLSGVIDGTIGTGLGVGGFICFVMAIVGGVKKLSSRGRKHHANEVLNHAERIAKVSERFYNLVSSSSPEEVKKDDVMRDISGFCLYVTLNMLTKAGYKIDDTKHLLEQCTKHIAFYVHRDIAYGDRYRQACLMWLEIVGTDGTIEDAKREMLGIMSRDYKLSSKTNVPEVSIVKNIESLIKVEALTESLR